MAPSPFDPAVVDAVGRVFGAHHGRGAAPSAAWGIFDRDGLAHFGSTGALPSGASPHRDTAYRIASCTKSFTAAAVLSLRDAGRLSLDDPLTRFMPGFGSVRLPTADAPVPTVRMLLTMSAGFPTDDPWADRQESITAGQLDELVESGLGFESVPGTRFAYSNLGYALLGRIIDVAAGAPYRDVIRDLFLEPLGLTGTGFDSSVADGAELAVGQRWIDGSWQPLPLSGPGAFSPIGGLFSTVTDLSRWAGWLAEAFAPGDDRNDESDRAAPDPLSSASRREMQQLQRYAAGATHPLGYGLGLFVEPTSSDESVISHSGGYPGYSAHMRWSASAGYGIIAFENATYSRVSVPAAEAFQLLAGARPPAAATLWAATREAQQRVTGLIHRAAAEAHRAGGDRLTAPDAEADADRASLDLFAMNVALDDSWERRRAAIERAAAEIGGLLPVPAVPPLPSPAGAVLAADEESTGPAHLVWFVPGRAGRLRVEIQLTPHAPPQVQSLIVSADRVTADRP
ncbi:serine hydrolase domain-containing protein [Glaciibacter sp. 2TAF33]|uniref:serine hydrolase domain-containing protein n=1 Tax=Glaciibacter sp. 2TAF33 TaxID=3233015 RepID=UPI003F93993A